MSLTNTAIRHAKPADKPYRLFDGKGLYLEVRPNGGRYWRFKYRFLGKEKRISLGTLPDVNLKAARKRCGDVREQLDAGIDPSAARKTAKTAQLGAESFEAVAQEWSRKHEARWSQGHIKRVERLFRKDLFPWIGQRSIRNIAAPELLSVLRRIENRGALETAHRARQVCGQVFRYAVGTGRAKRDPTSDLRGALPPVITTHFATLTDPKAIGQLLRDIDGYCGRFVTRCALKLAPIVWVRPGELRHAEWSEIDLDVAEWRIPGDKMKGSRPHIVPLANQAVLILKELHSLTGSGRYVFPSVRSTQRCMSENTVNAALRGLGYEKDQITGHGFRGMASTILNEQGWHRDAIERQLAHVEQNSVRAAYNHADYLPERRKMMEAWAEYLTSLAAGANVTSIASRQAGRVA